MLDLKGSVGYFDVIKQVYFSYLTAHTYCSTLTIYIIASAASYIVLAPALFHLSLLLPD
jgi:hypothetical protein